MIERAPSQPTGASQGRGPDVPPDLADLACARLLAASVDERESVLAELCRLHGDHAAGLRHLHAELMGADRMLQENLVPPAADELRSVGPFAVVRRLGEGAFGVVYLCAQGAPIERQVAVKVLRPGAGSRQTLARFAAERQVLARMSHPAIANVFDAGALQDGRPYFVMEYVDGEPITTFCDQRKLPVAERLALFLALCDGVQHAHQKGVIHRDLKPSNVLVRDLQGKTQPKIIDFGLAKVMSDRPVGHGQLTEAGGVLGTPGFMSPEQGEGRHEDVDTRSDVFSLGVILYVLLAGDMPWGRGGSTADAPPLRPSARLGGESKQSTVTASQRSAEPRRLQSLLRGDLDWITLRALERDRDRRYQTVQELAEDLRRHLRHEPVLAGPPSTIYRLQKLVRRYRIQVGAAAAVLLSLLIGLLGVARYASRAHDNLQRFEILAIGTRLALARASASNLYPPWPERLADFDRWLAEHGYPLHAEQPRLQHALAELRAQGTVSTPADRAADRERPADAEIGKRRATIAYLEALLEHPAVQGDARAQLRKTLTDERDRQQSGLPALERAQAERQTWTFASAGQQFLHDTMVRLVEEMRLFCEGEGSLPVLARQREEIVAEMAMQERRAELWQRTAAEIEGDPRYGGLRLAPQFGLVPLGRDAASGLHEFYHLRSGPAGGTIPVRGAGGRLELDESAGIVFVLVPGGRALLGAQNTDPAAPCYDAGAKTATSPVHEVVLAPFFLGKHEVTQLQWWHLTDTLPSHFHRNTVSPSGQGITGRHPVENVTWQECERGLAKQGLELPTEAQWEYACRAGTTTVWPSGDSAEDLGGFAHVAGGSEPIGVRAVAGGSVSPIMHAPAGSFAANAFGLHDMVGNVAEWCRDNFSSLAYLLPPRPGDGLRPVPEMQNRAVRGGSFEDDPSDGTSAVRFPVSLNTRVRYLGVRAARSVQPARPDGN